MIKADIFNRLKVMLVSLSTQAVVGTADYLTGDELHLDVFYFIPISICAWYLRRSEIFISAIIGALTWGYADIRAGHQYSSPAYLYWNICVCFGSLLILGLVVKSLRENLLKKELARQELLQTLDNLRRSTTEIEKLQSQLQVVCAWSKHIRVNGQWMTFEDFLKKHLHLQLTHGISPEAMEKFTEEIKKQNHQILEA